MPKLLPDYPGTPRKPPRWMYLRSFLPVVFLILLFSFSLASYSLLSHFRSPAKKQQIGWQSWDIVNVYTAKAKTGQGVMTGANGTDWSDEDDEDDDEDWWAGYQPSIPLDQWVKSRPSATRLVH